MKTTHNNLSYCLSKHIEYENERHIDSRLCFLLSAALGTCGRPLSQLLHHQINDFELRTSYISSTNHFTLETFANNCGYELFMLHDYNSKSELDWLLSMSKTTTTKFLVKVSNRVLLTETDKSACSEHIPVYAILDIKEDLSPNELYSDKTIFQLHFNTEKKIRITAERFKEFWIIKNSMLNGLRYVLTTPLTDDNSESHLHYLIETAFLRQFCALNQKSQDSNNSLFVYLSNRLRKDNSEIEISEQRDLWERSFKLMTSKGETNMNRSYFVHCLEYAQKLGLCHAPNTINSYKKVSASWTSFQNMIYANSASMGNELAEGYNELIDAEQKALVHFKKELIK